MVGVHRAVGSDAPKYCSREGFLYYRTVVGSILGRNKSGTTPKNNPKCPSFVPSQNISVPK